MKGQLPIALFAVLWGAVETAAGLQETVYVGILQSRTEPLIMGALGTVGGALLVAAGVALLVGSRLTDVLVRSSLYVAIPVYLLIGVIKHYAAWPSVVLGIGYPLLMLFLWQKVGKQTELAKA